MESTHTANEELRILRMPEVTALCGISRTGVYEAIKKGEFPKQVHLSVRAIGWVQSEVEAWVRKKMAAR